MEYYSVIKMNEIIPFAITWMDLETTILSKVRQRNTHSITHMWTLNDDASEFIYKT